MSYDYMRLGMRITALRKDNKYTQKEIYTKLGISQSYYSKIENGNAEINISLLSEIAKVLSVPLPWIVDNNVSQLTDSERLELENYKKYLISKRNK